MSDIAQAEAPKPEEPPFDENHHRCQVSIIASAKAEFAVGAYLSQRGHDVYIPRKRIAPTRAEAWKYSDNGDVRHRLNGLGRFHRLEVKWRPRLDWTCRENYPYQEGIFVCSVGSFLKLEKKDKLPVAFWQVSRNLRYAAVIETQTKRRQWRCHPVAENQYKEKEDYWICDLDVAKWIDLDECPTPVELLEIQRQAEQ